MEKVQQLGSYSLGIVNNRFETINENQLFPADHDQRHKFSWVHNYSLSKWDFSLSWHYTTGLPYTTPVGHDVRLDTEGEEEYFLVYSQLNNARLPNYHRLDLAANYKLDTKNWTGKIGVSIFNLYDRTNLQDIDFFVLPPQTQAGRSLPEEIIFQRDMMRFTPNFFFHINW